MKKGKLLPKQKKSFFDNYKALFFAAVLLISFQANGQAVYDSTKTLSKVSGYGFLWKNGQFEGSFTVPRDTFKLGVKDSGALAYKNTVFYGWTGYVWVAFAGGGGSDITKLNVADTANTWVKSIVKVNDSVFFKIGTTYHFAYKDSAGGSTDTTSISNRIDARVKYSDTASMLNAYQHWTQGYLKAADITGKADKATTITINGVAQDLTTNRTWNLWVDTTGTNPSLLTVKQFLDRLKDSLDANNIYFQTDTTGGVPVAILGDTTKFRNLLAGTCFTVTAFGDSTIRLSADTACLATLYPRRQEFLDSLADIRADFPTGGSVSAPSGELIYGTGAASASSNKVRTDGNAIRVGDTGITFDETGYFFNADGSKVFKIVSSDTHTDIVFSVAGQPDGSIRMRVLSDGSYVFLSNYQDVFKFKQSGQVQGVPYYSGTGIRPIAVDSVGNIVYNPSNTEYWAGFGQSNMYGSSDDVIDTAHDDRVKVWDRISGTWKRWIIGETPTNGYSATSPNVMFYAAMEYAKKHNKEVRVTVLGLGGYGIEKWTDSMRYVLNTVLDSSLQGSKLNLMVMDLGESNSASTAAYWNTRYDTLKGYFRTKTYADSALPWVNVGMGRYKQGAPYLNENIDGPLRATDGNNDVWDGYASTEKSPMDAFPNNVHFGSLGLKNNGKQVVAAYEALPALAGTQNTADAFQNFFTPYGVYLGHGSSTFNGYVGGYIPGNLTNIVIGATDSGDVNTPTTLYKNQSGQNILAIGNHTAEESTTGNNILAIGNGAVNKNTVYSNIWAAGIDAARNGTTAHEVTAGGHGSLKNNIGGLRVVAYGDSSAYSTKNGNDILVAGSGAGKIDTALNNVVLLGSGSGGLAYNLNGGVAIGTQTIENGRGASGFLVGGPFSSQYTTSGADFIHLGSYSGQYSKATSYGLRMGTRAGRYDSSANGSHYKGFESGMLNNGGGNNFDGYQTGVAALDVYNTNLTGDQVGRAMQHGFENDISGPKAAYNGTTITYSTISGASALYNASNVTAITGTGLQAFYNLATGTQDAGIGDGVFKNLTAGDYNFGGGTNAGANLTAGSSNVPLGPWAGLANPTGSGQLNLHGIIWGTGGYTGAAVYNTPVAGAKVGIGTNAPDSQLTLTEGIKAANARFTNLPSGAGTDSVVTVDGNGTLKKRDASLLGGGTDSNYNWRIDGNTGLGSTKLLGTKDNQSFGIIANNAPMAYFIPSVTANGGIALGNGGAASTVQVNGSLAASYVEKTSTYTATNLDYTINCPSGTFTINLPTAVGITGRIYNIKNSGAGTITIDPDGTELIDGASTEPISIQYTNIKIQSTGAGWIILW